MNYLLDTCVISELIEPEADPGVTGWLGAQEEHRLYISVVTLGQIQAGISKLADSRRKLALVSWLNNDMTSRFSGRLLAVDAEVAIIWGTKRGRAAASGRTLPLADSLIAASAIARGMTVVTRNTYDFEQCGSMTLNPWSC